jgi:GR25 family glycosyltransferase involved in LPS biosynthesis
MNNPLGSYFGGFRLKSLKNKVVDENSIVDLRGQVNLDPKNKCTFPTKVFVINRVEREDRMEKFKVNNPELYQSFDVQRWEAVTPGLRPGSDVVDAIFQSFSTCMEFGFSESESIIIMEDDSYLAKGGIEKLSEAWKDLPDDWDVLIGNHYFFGQIEILTDNIAKPTDRASTANFGVYRKSIFQKIKDNEESREGNFFKRDFDHFITSNTVPINNYTIWPMISREIPSFSDHKGKELDSSIRIRENAFKYRFVDEETYYPSLEGWN